MNRVTRALGLIVLFSAALAAADEVHLKNGGKVIGKVTEEGDKITVLRAGGIKVTLTRDQIEKIVYVKDEPAPAPPAAAPPAVLKPPSEPKAVKEVELKLVTPRDMGGGGRRFAPILEGRYLLNTSEKGWNRLVRLSDWRGTDFYGAYILPMADGQKVLVSQPFGGSGAFVCGPEDDPRNGKAVAGGGYSTPALLTPGGQWYVGFDGRNGVEIWAASALDKKPTQIKRPDVPQGGPRGAYCPDPKTVVVWTGDGVLQSYLLPEAKAGPAARVVPTDRERFQNDLRGERAQWPSDGKTVVVATTEEIATFDGRTLQPKVRQPIASPPKSPWRLSGSGKYLASVIAAEPGGAARVRLSSVSDLKTVAEWRRPFGAPTFNDFAFSADDRYLAVVADTDAAVLTLPKLEFIAYAKLTHTTAPWVSFLDAKTVIVSTDGETYLLPFAP